MVIGKRGLAIILSALAGSGFAQETPGDSGPLVASPVPAAPTSTAPFIDLTSPDSPPPAIAAKAALPKGTQSHLSEQIARAGVVEEYQAEKIKVYPDDPDSAWWETNVRVAFARAQREQKPLLLLFTAMWVPQAMNLSAEVFATRSFNQYVKDNLVICYLSFPQNLKDAPRSMQWAKKEFKVAGYPSVLLFNPRGEVERSLRGYRKGRPVDYFNDLKQACAPVIADLETRKASLAKKGFRDWHNPEGRVLFAQFVRRDDLLMTLRDCTGQEWTVAINQLSGEDQVLARSFPRLDDLNPGDF